MKKTRGKKDRNYQGSWKKKKKERNMELVVESSKKKKAKCESQQDLEKVESIEVKQQHAEETTVWKEHDNISEILLNKAMKNKEMRGNKNSNNITLN